MMKINQFIHQGQTWSTQWPLAEEQGWQFFRLADGNLAQDLVNALRTVNHLIAIRLDFFLASYPMRLSDVEEMQGKHGWMKVSKIAVMAAGTLRKS